jgi:hypothetical protein
MPGEGVDRDAEATMFADIVLLYDFFNIAQQFRLTHVAPTEDMLLEGKRVQFRCDVDFAAGIAVVPPCPAWTIGSLKDNEVVDPALLQIDASRDAARPAPMTATAWTLAPLGECLSLGAVSLSRRGSR